ncbi:hypothetical protein [Streptomyces sp. NEAU-H3]|nr:hypothetical protein [Streptomyces sp. NEAU-H3]
MSTETHVTVEIAFRPSCGEIVSSWCTIARTIVGPSTSTRRPIAA